MALKKHFLIELMRICNSHRGAQVPSAAMRLVWDVEVPFIR